MITSDWWFAFGFVGGVVTKLVIDLIAGPTPPQAARKPKPEEPATPYRSAGQSGEPYVEALVAEVAKPPIVTDFSFDQRQGDWTYVCIKCGSRRYFPKAAPEYCECKRCPVGHFHMGCSCKAKWIMRAADAKERAKEKFTVVTGIGGGGGGGGTPISSAGTPFEFVEPGPYAKKEEKSE
jgi:hypothetical protein